MIHFSFPKQSSPELKKKFVLLNIALSGMTPVNPQIIGEEKKQERRRKKARKKKKREMAVFTKFL